VVFDVCKRHLSETVKSVPQIFEAVLDVYIFELCRVGLELLMASSTSQFLVNFYSYSGYNRELIDYLLLLAAVWRPVGRLHIAMQRWQLGTPFTRFTDGGPA